MKKFLNGISRALCVMFICVFAGCSYAGSGDTNNNPPTEPETYTVTFDANSKATVYLAYNTETHKWTKKGYRLPTEAEWEFCARGGNPKANAWKCAYAGAQTEKDPSKFTSNPSSDVKLDDYGWNSNNSSGKTLEVSSAYRCAVSCRCSNYPYYVLSFQGLRVVRTTNRQHGHSVV